MGKGGEKNAKGIGQRTKGIEIKTEDSILISENRLQKKRQGYWLLVNGLRGGI
jgi:hypothetical protein